MLQSHLVKQSLLVYCHQCWRPLLGGIKRDKLNGTNQFLQKSAVSCGFLRKSAVSSGFLRKDAPPNAVISRKSVNQQKSAKICQKITANLAPFVPFSLSLLIPLELLRLGRQFWCHWEGGSRTSQSFWNLRLPRISPNFPRAGKGPEKGDKEPAKSW